MIKVDALSFGYGKKGLFKELNLSLGPGLYGLLGKNGAGKSTLLKILSGLLFAGKGRCEVMGFAPENREPEYLSNLFYLPEEFYIPGIKGSEYEEIYSPFYPGFDKDKFKSHVNEFELDNSKLLTSFSYGQKKKFLIAFGLASGAGVMLLDEPTNGLDIPSKSQFRRLVSSAVSDERCIMISTHQVRDMEGLIDPVVIVDNGIIIFNRGMDEISGKLKYSFSLQQPSGSAVIHAEKVVGGWAVISRGDGYSDGSAIDLEVLFNAVIQKHQVIDNILSGKDNENE